VYVILLLLLLSLLNVVEVMIDLLAPLYLLLLPLVECGHHFCVTSLQVREAVVEVGGVNMDAWLVVAFLWWMVRLRVRIVVLLWRWLVVVLRRVMKSKWSYRVEITRATGREGRTSSLKILCCSVLLWIRRMSIKVTTPPLGAR
jgi:hypothetical protein